MPYALFGLVVLVLWIYCVVDVLTRPESDFTHLPKIGWLLVVVLLPTLGSILWLVVGRPAAPYRPASNTSYSEYDRPGRYVAQNPESDEAFLRQLRERAESQRREARRQEEERQRREDERRARGDQ